MPDATAQPDRNHRRRLRTRAALVDAARRVFAERGVEGATIQQITDAADLAKGSFYNHFDSHDDILRAVVADTLDRLGTALDRRRATAGGDPARVVAQSLYASLRACVADPVVGGFVLHGAEAVDLAEAVLGKRGRRDLAAGVGSGRFRVADPDLAATAIAGAAAAVIRRRLRGELPASAEADLVVLALRILGLAEDEAHHLVDAIVTAPGGDT